MSNIRVDVDYTIKDGTEIKFRSPVDCSTITGLKVYYLGADGNTASKVFDLADAHGNNVGDIDHLFAEDVVVKVILDVGKNMAFVQNADTNAYLESRFEEVTNYATEIKNSAEASASQLGARIDGIASLKDGSTTGDAELIDARVGADSVTYTNLGGAVRGQVDDLRNNMYANIPGRNLTDFLTVTGSIRSSNGTINTGATTYKCSDYIPVGAGDVVAYKDLIAVSSIALVAVFDKSKTFKSAKSGSGSGVLAYGTVTVEQDGYIRICTTNASAENATIEIVTNKKELNILVLGNSFAQDSFAYLPPVLNEILPDYRINYGVAYRSSADISDHIKLYYKKCGTPQPGDDKGLEDGKYTVFSYWPEFRVKWTRYYQGEGTSTSGVRLGKTLQDILDLHKWDIIYVQPVAGGLTTAPIDEKVRDDIVIPGRTLLDILRAEHGGRFSLLMGQWLAEALPSVSPDDVGEVVFGIMTNLMQKVKQNIGILDYVPIGTAIQNARSNATMQALGENANKNMLYDNHMQSGLAPLIATYTIALKILECIGESHRGIYGSTFVPTTENCVAINAYDSAGMDARPKPMTHGASQGVTTANIRAAQEIAVLAVNNPTTITDCSEIFERYSVE